MAFKIVPYTDEHVAAVREFNRRLREGGVAFAMPELPVPDWLPMLADRRIFQEYYVLLEDTVVRGGYVLKHQDFFLSGEVLSIADYRMPISEGVVDKAYNLVGVQLLTDALKRQPVMYGLGMGGFDQPIAKMLKAMGWTMFAVPFFFWVNHPFRFLRNIVALRKSAMRRFLLDLLAVSGLGWLGIKLLHWFRREKWHESWAWETLPQFGSWADELWEACKNQHPLAAVRDAATLNILYPPEKKEFIKLKVSSGDRVVGWAVLLNTPMIGHKQFGNMRVGTVVDCLALSNHKPKVVFAAVECLTAASADIVITNQSDQNWCAAFRRTGFLSGPSNFIFAASKKLAAHLQPFDEKKNSIHMTRGDGDGPIHL
ncbi:MAG: hypothetical protein HY706_16270 [Candidatus Hydrogenedentes bacterium]|nr:hypothetical protein [Candidatus Hydrogenedentota bacterium]